MTQGDFAKKLGITVNHLNAVLNAREDASRKLAGKMAEYLGCKPRVFTDGTKSARIRFWRMYQAQEVKKSFNENDYRKNW